MRKLLGVAAATVLLGLVLRGTATGVEVAALYEFEEISGSSFADTQGILGGGFGGGEGVDFTLNDPGAPNTFGSTGFRNLGVSTGGAAIISDLAGLFEVPDSLSIAMWTKPATFSNFSNFLDYSNTGNGANLLTSGYRLQTSNNASDDNFRALVETGGGRAAVTHTRNITADTWHLLVMRYNHLTGQVGLNVLSEADTVTSSFVSSNFQATTNPSFAGGVDYSGTVGTLLISDVALNGTNAGSFDDVVIFSDLITDQDVADIFNNGVRDVATLLLPGDVDGDTSIDMDDFDIIRGNFFETVTSRAEGDLSGDNLVDFVDFRIWKDNVPASMGAAAFGMLTGTPEPSSLVVCCVALPLVAGRFRRF